MLLGVRTVIYPAPDLAAAKASFTALLGFGPYFDEPFYVGYEVGGYELGLDPNADPAVGAVAFWGVADAEEAYAALLAAGARPGQAVNEVGDGIKVGTVLEATGATFGIIENPHFTLPAAADPDGPGR